MLGMGSSPSQSGLALKQALAHDTAEGGALCSDPGVVRTLVPTDSYLKFVPQLPAAPEQPPRAADLARDLRLNSVADVAHLFGCYQKYKLATHYQGVAGLSAGTGKTAGSAVSDGEKAYSSVMQELLANSAEQQKGSGSSASSSKSDVADSGRDYYSTVLSELQFYLHAERCAVLECLCLLATSASDACYRLNRDDLPGGGTSRLQQQPPSADVGKAALSFFKSNFQKSWTVVLKSFQEVTEVDPTGPTDLQIGLEFQIACVETLVVLHRSAEICRKVSQARENRDLANGRGQAPGWCVLPPVPRANVHDVAILFGGNEARFHGCLVSMKNKLRGRFFNVGSALALGPTAAGPSSTNAVATISGPSPRHQLSGAHFQLVQHLADVQVVLLLQMILGYGAKNPTITTEEVKNMHLLIGEWVDKAEHIRHRHRSLDLPPLENCVGLGDSIEARALERHFLNSAALVAMGWYWYLSHQDWERLNLVLDSCLGRTNFLVRDKAIFPTAVSGLIGRRRLFPKQGLIREFEIGFASRTSLAHLGFEQFHDIHRAILKDYASYLCFGAEGELNVTAADVIPPALLTALAQLVKACADSMTSERRPVNGEVLKRVLDEPGAGGTARWEKRSLVISGAEDAKKLRKSSERGVLLGVLAGGKSIAEGILNPQDMTPLNPFLKNVFELCAKDAMALQIWHEDITGGSGAGLQVLIRHFLADMPSELPNLLDLLTSLLLGCGERSSEREEMGWKGEVEAESVKRRQAVLDNVLRIIQETKISSFVLPKRNLEDQVHPVDEYHEFQLHSSFYAEQLLLTRGFGIYVPPSYDPCLFEMTPRNTMVQRHDANTLVFRMFADGGRGSVGGPGQPSSEDRPKGGFTLYPLVFMLVDAFLESSKGSGRVKNQKLFGSAVEFLAQLVAAFPERFQEQDPVFGQGGRGEFSMAVVPRLFRAVVVCCRDPDFEDLVPKLLKGLLAYFRCDDACTLVWGGAAAEAADVVSNGRDVEMDDPALEEDVGGEPLRGAAPRRGYYSVRGSTVGGAGFFGGAAAAVASKAASSTSPRRKRTHELSGSRQERRKGMFAVLLAMEKHSGEFFEAVEAILGREKQAGVYTLTASLLDFFGDVLDRTPCASWATNWVALAGERSVGVERVDVALASMLPPQGQNGAGPTAQLRESQLQLLEKVLKFSLSDVFSNLNCYPYAHSDDATQKRELSKRCVRIMRISLDSAFGVRDFLNHEKTSSLNHDDMMKSLHAGVKKIQSIIFRSLSEAEAIPALCELLSAEALTVTSTNGTHLVGFSSLFARTVFGTAATTPAGTTMEDEIDSMTTTGGKQMERTLTQYFCGCHWAHDAETTEHSGFTADFDQKLGSELLVELLDTLQTLLQICLDDGGPSIHDAGLTQLRTHVFQCTTKNRCQRKLSATTKSYTKVETTAEVFRLDLVKSLYHFIVCDPRFFLQAFASVYFMRGDHIPMPRGDASADVATVLAAQSLERLCLLWSRPEFLGRGASESVHLSTFLAVNATPSHLNNSESSHVVLVGGSAGTAGDGGGALRGGTTELAKSGSAAARGGVTTPILLGPKLVEKVLDRAESAATPLEVKSALLSLCVTGVRTQASVFLTQDFEDVDGADGGAARPPSAGTRLARKCVTICKQIMHEAGPFLPLHTGSDENTVDKEVAVNSREARQRRARFLTAAPVLWYNLQLLGEAVRTLFVDSVEVSGVILLVMDIHQTLSKIIRTEKLAQISNQTPLDAIELYFYLLQMSKEVHYCALAIITKMSNKMETIVLAATCSGGPNSGAARKAIDVELTKDVFSQLITLIGTLLADEQEIWMLLHNQGAEEGGSSSSGGFDFCRSGESRASGSVFVPSMEFQETRKRVVDNAARLGLREEVLDTFANPLRAVAGGGLGGGARSGRFAGAGACWGVGSSSSEVVFAAAGVLAAGGKRPSKEFGRTEGSLERLIEGKHGGRSELGQDFWELSNVALDDGLERDGDLEVEKAPFGGERPDVDSVKMKSQGFYADIFSQCERAKLPRASACSRRRSLAAASSSAAKTLSLITSHHAATQLGKEQLRMRQQTSVLALTDGTNGPSSNFPPQSPMRSQSPMRGFPPAVQRTGTTTSTERLLTELCEDFEQFSLLSAVVATQRETLSLFLQLVLAASEFSCVYLLPANESQVNDILSPILPKLIEFLSFLLYERVQFPTPEVASEIWNGVRNDPPDLGGNLPPAAKGLQQIAISSFMMSKPEHRPTVSTYLLPSLSLLLTLTSRLFYFPQFCVQLYQFPPLAKYIEVENKPRLPDDLQRVFGLIDDSNEEGVRVLALNFSKQLSILLAACVRSLTTCPPAEKGVLLDSVMSVLSLMLMLLPRLCPEESEGGYGLGLADGVDFDADGNVVWEDEESSAVLGRPSGALVTPGGTRSGGGGAFRPPVGKESLLPPATPRDHDRSSVLQTPEIQRHGGGHQRHHQLALRKRIDPAQRRFRIQAEGICVDIMEAMIALLHYHQERNLEAEPGGSSVPRRQQNGGGPVVGVGLKKGKGGREVLLSFLVFSTAHAGTNGDVDQPRRQGR